MRILTRYILKEIFSHSLLGLLVFTFVVYVRPLGQLLELAVRHSLSPSGMLALFVLPLPGILVLTIPMSVLVGVLIGLSRMAADGEVIAVRASGIGLGQFVRPVIAFALLGWAVTSWMSLHLAPRAANQLNQMQVELRNTQASYEIRPRVFIEQFPNLLLYLEDVTGAKAHWRGVFLADTTQRDSMKVTLAETGMLVNAPESNRLTVHLQEGTTHEIDPQHPEQYSVISFARTAIPIPLDQRGPASVRGQPNTFSLPELLASARNPRERPAALVELHYRLALPVASLVLALVGIPLGLSTRKGGKAFGMLITILLVFIYYMIMAFGLSFSKQGRLNPALGLWLANLGFGAVGALMLLRIHQVRRRFERLSEWFDEFRRRGGRLVEHWRGPAARAVSLRQPRAGTFRLQILDIYIIRDWLLYLALLLVTFIGIYIIFDFFQLLGDIVRNHAGTRLVFNYYRYLTPQVAYLMLPLSILVATLISFSLLTKTNQITAIKSAGISLYRISIPVFIAAAVLSGSMFLLEDRYLPETNQRQDALRNQIKGKPAQTYYRPDRQWIFGRSNRIFNYRFFDPDRNVFANLSVFELDPQRFRMTRRIYAARAFWEPPIRGWILENGWVRELEGDRVKTYMPFSVATFQELNEEPAYFKKEVRPSQQMSAFELYGYIKELSQSGFDVVRLSVQLYRKFSFPLIAFVVTLIGIPFSFTMGRKGTLSGIALSIGIAIIYWATSSLFEAMGNLHQLPPIVAAWSPDFLFGLGGAYLLLRIRT
jgi:LPS export ABC transporter permease LptF/LPS export ABC transporter permease LptG